MDETQQWIDRNLQPPEDEGSGRYDYYGEELYRGEEIYVSPDGALLREEDLFEFMNDRLKEEIDLVEMAKMIQFLDNDHVEAMAIESLKENIQANFKNKDIAEYFDMERTNVDDII